MPPSPLPPRALSRRRHSQTQTPRGHLQAEPRQGPQLLRPRLLLYCSSSGYEFVLEVPFVEKDQAKFKEGGREGEEEKTRHTQQDNVLLLFFLLTKPFKHFMNSLIYGSSDPKKK